ncbi:DNA methyltransferase [Planktothrix mougeotii]|uniref:site-specific DNA-methyltransferase (cytosine-N(4)-specific) n=1 Tax=Planktothrix mougeotii LEGE 06226 TaxID=1828728 RepID=A0ABR9UBK0_9CYAN|nr:DNA methyltransferase [Planktothrix mougeotii]MBE9143176.1 DNA adenine methylase [Planktothrix mougeotii LEGE 06226]
MLSTVKQRPEYTFKYNQNLGRHGWLRLTPAYGVKLVEKLLTSVEPDAIILDPFSGTGTTGLVAAEQGKQTILLDINPFLVWLGTAKCRNYSKAELTDIRNRIKLVFQDYKTLINQDNWIPPIFNIERWWSRHTLKLLTALRTALVNYFGEPENNHYSLVWIAFCRLIIETSSASFNHVSMSFQETVNQFDIEYTEELFLTILEFILNTAETNISGMITIIETDSKTLIGLDHIKADQVITSPPYPNRMSYIRELRPYMYWTKFITEAKEAGEIDWLTIGGTWGIATSRLNSWQIEEKNLPKELFITVDKINKSGGKNADLMAIYVLKYFHDIHLHLSSLRSILKDQANLYYIIGNSNFFNNTVDTALILSESLKILGYKQINYEIIRKRNCNKALYEYCVSASRTESKT